MRTELSSTHGGGPLLARGLFVDAIIEHPPVTILGSAGQGRDEAPPEVAHRPAGCARAQLTNGGPPAPARAASAAHPARPVPGRSPRPQTRKHQVAR